MLLGTLIAWLSIASGAAGDVALPAYDTTATDTTATDTTARPAAEAPALELDVGGALRYNFVFRDWQEGSRDRGGDLAFDTFRLNADGGYGGLRFAAEYRLYSGYHMLKTGWVGYQFSDGLHARFGVHQVPFGITTYASNSWFFQIPYYVGLEDDHDAGVRLDYDAGPLALRAAFYKNAEGPFSGSSRASARYSYDVVPSSEGALDYGTAPVAGARSNQETNQANLKLTYTARHGGSGATEVGASVQRGGLYNLTTEQTGWHWAGAGHVHGTYGRFDVKVELIRYQHRPENPAGQDERFVVMGAYDAPYKVARDGTIYVAGLRYTVPVRLGPVSAVQFYNDYSYLDKDPAGYHDTVQNITGALVVAGPLYVYNDVVYARNHPFAIPGRSFAAALAEGTDAWHLRFNVNVGYYF